MKYKTEMTPRIKKTLLARIYFHPDFSSNFNLNSKPITMKSLLLLFAIVCAVACTEKNPGNFDLKNIQEKNPEISAIQNEVLKVTPTSDNQSLTIWEGTDAELWKNANYLVCEVWHENDFSGILNIGFYRDEKGQKILNV